MKWMKSISILGVVAALVTGCAVGPKYERPAAELPSAWRDLPVQGQRAPTERWWTIYADPALERLMEEALVHNQDLALATARVDEARALLRVTDSFRMPAIDATASRDRTLRLWNPTNAQALKTLEGHNAWVEGVAVTNRGTALATVAADRTVRLWALD